MAAMSDPYQSYRQIQVETADQPTLLIMLYQGALKFIRQGRVALQENNIEEANHRLGRVQDILCELMGSLNPEVPDLSGSLFQLYEFMHYRLVQANVQRDAAMLTDVEQMLSSLMEAWQSVLGREKAPIHG